MRIVDFEPRHLRRVAPQPMQAELGLYRDWLADRLDPYALRGCAFTGLIDGKVVGCAGVRPLWAGVGEAWAVFSLDALDRPFALFRAAARGMATIEDRQGLRRIQATCHANHPEGARFLEALGFRREGVLRRYGLGGEGNYWLYARTR
jgi:RimJ/RimL family protein N-acetyltransferase